MYAAYDPDLDRRVAIKLLRSAATTAARHRLLREAKAMAKLSHPGVVTVFEVGTVDNRDFIAMEFVDGPTLKDWIGARRAEAERGRRQARTYVTTALGLFTEAGRGLAAAHDAGLVHRDLKPANILLGDDGRAKVGDFGIAQEVGTAPAAVADSASSLATSARFGTPAYMAPEQLEGHTADARSDQFSLAVALYEALYGERPFRGDTAAELRENMAAQSAPHQPRGARVPKHVRHSLRIALSVGPDRRFPSVNAFLAALRPPTRRNVGVVVAVVVVAVAIGTALFVSRRNSATVGNQCTQQRDQLAGIWDEDARVRTRSALEATNLPYARDAYDRLQESLDSYASEWVRAYRDSCRKTYVKRAQQESEHALRLSCLQERLGQLRSTVDVLAKADATTVARVAEAAATLPPVSDCNDVASLKKGIQPPKDSATRERVAHVRAQLAETRTLMELARRGAALTAARGAVAEAQTIGYVPLVAEAMLRMGQALAANYQVAEARTSLEEASLLAEEAGYEDVRAQALVARADLAAGTSSHQLNRQSWSRRARAAVARAGHPPELAGRLAAAIADAAVAEGNNKRARERIEQAIEIYEDALSMSSERSAQRRLRLALARALDTRAVILEGEGKPRAAVASATRARTIAEQVHGPDHPQVIGYVERIALALREAGDFDRAEELMERSRQFYATPSGRELAAQLTIDPTLSIPKTTRIVTGRVIDAEGTPVPGSTVGMASHVFGDARYALVSYGGARELHTGTQRATTDEFGRFRLEVADDRPMFAIAEKSSVGRAWPLRVPPGSASVDIELRLATYGRLSGRVTANGKRPPSTHLGVQALYRPPSNPPRTAVAARVDKDGRFEIERLAPGQYEVFFGTMSQRASHGLALYSRTVKIGPGETIDLELDIGAGGVSFSAAVRGKQGATIGSAQVIMFPGRVRPTVAAEVNKLVIQKGATVRASFAHTDGRPARFSRMPPGLYSVCVVPLDGDYRDPEYSRALRPTVERLAVHCYPLTLNATPQSVHRTFEVPPMQTVSQP